MPYILLRGVWPGGEGAGIVAHMSVKMAYVRSCISRVSFMKVLCVRSRHWGCMAAREVGV